MLNVWHYTIFFLPLLAGFWETEKKKKISLVQQRLDWLVFSLYVNIDSNHILTYRYTLIEKKKHNTITTNWPLVLNYHVINSMF